MNCIHEKEEKYRVPESNNHSYAPIQIKNDENLRKNDIIKIMLNEHKGKNTFPKKPIKLIILSQSYQMKWIQNFTYLNLRKNVEITNII